MPLTLTEESARAARRSSTGPAICGGAEFELAWQTRGGLSAGNPPRRGAVPANVDPDAGSRRQGLLARLFAAVQRSKTAEAGRLIAHYRQLTQ